MKFRTLTLSVLLSISSLCGLLQAQITGVTAGTDLTGGGTSGNVALNLDTTKVPRLAAANSFVGNQSVKGNIKATGTVAGSEFLLGSQLFGSGSYTNGNVFLGFAGNSSSTGVANTATGYQALLMITNGVQNTATGYSALTNNSTGGGNVAEGSNAFLSNTSGSLGTAVGVASGAGNVTGSFNTFLGFDAGVSVDPLTNVTAIGAYATAGENSALILGGTSNHAVSVGIGTATPYNDYALDVDTTNSNGVINGGVVVNASGGNLYLGMTKTVHKFRVDTNGVAYADGGFVASGADFAESVSVRGQHSLYQPGDLLEIARGAHRTVALSQSPYSTRVAGIYSTKPGVLASPHALAERDENDEKIDGEVPLAMVGIVPCNVTTENGAIREGDLLVASSRPGYAMKGTDRRRMLGAVVGKALEPLSKGTGSIQVLVTLQ